MRFVNIIYLNLLIVWLGTIFIVFHFLKDDRSIQKSVQNEIRSINVNSKTLLEQQVLTYSGYEAFKVIEQKAYKDFGYNISKATYPIVTLSLTYKLNCSIESVYYLNVSNTPHPSRPPKYIPDDFTYDFVMSGYSGLSYNYKNEKNTVDDSWGQIEELVGLDVEELALFERDILSMHYAMKSHNINGKRGLVLSTNNAIVEIFALKHGARKLHSVGHFENKVDSERVTSISLSEFATRMHRFESKFDFIATFSTIEHLGLGKYGEKLDYVGDLRVMLLLNCALKPGGLLFLGLPLGPDSLVFNEKRIYGVVRLPMIMAGFEWIDIYDSRSSSTSSVNIGNLNIFEHITRTLVLKKI